jgi:hypothetical protein
MAANRKKKPTKKEREQKAAEKIGAAPSDPKQSKPARKNAKAPKSKPEAPVSGNLSTLEQARSLWAKPKAKRAKKK